MTVEQQIAEAVRAVVREEVRAALAEHRAGPAGEWLSTDEAAEIAGVQPKTVRAWVSSGLPASKRGRRLVIARSALEAYRRGVDRDGAALLSSLTRSAG